MLPFLLVLAAFILLLAAIDIYVYRNWRAFVRTRDGRGFRSLRWTLPLYLALVPLMALLLPATILLSNWWEVEPKLLRGITAGLLMLNKTKAVRIVERVGNVIASRLGFATDSLRLVLRQGIVVTAIGIGIGLVAALALTRVMESLLYGVASTDAFALLGATAILAATALLASCLPARRAAGMDPLEALRVD